MNAVAVFRAFVKNIFRLKRTSGASTITMQVARALEPKRRTYGNKIIEMFRAFQLEWKYNKDEIFQIYLNVVPYGGNIEGVKSASILYFKKIPIIYRWQKLLHCQLFQSAIIINHWKKQRFDY